MFALVDSVQMIVLNIFCDGNPNRHSSLAGEAGNVCSFETLGQWKGGSNGGGCLRIRPVDTSVAMDARTRPQRLGQPEDGLTTAPIGRAVIIGFDQGKIP